MISYINSIALHNFYNFYGDYEQNVYEFNPGLNIIVADNGGGKSKLFNGFSWILQDKVFDSDQKSYYNVNESMVLMISDKAKSETSVNGDVSCGVKIVFSDDNFEYEVEKKFWAKRLNYNSVTDADTWKFTFDDLRVSKKDKYLLDYRVIYDRDEKIKIVRKIIDSAFLKYALLQGEEVDKILDFTERKSLQEAINTLTNISTVNDLLPIAENFFKRAGEDLLSARKRIVSDKSQFDQKIKRKDALSEAYSRKTTEIENLRINLVKAKEERDGLINSISNAQTRQKIRNEQNNIDNTLKELDSQHATFLNNLNDRFFEERYAWLLLSTSAYGEQFFKFRDHYLDQRKEKKIAHDFQQGKVSFLTKLPEGSPDSYSLREMLEKETCFVCGRPAHKDSPEWEHIHNVLKTHSLPEKSTFKTKQDFSGLLGKLLTSSQSYFNQVPKINDGILDTRKKDKSYRDGKIELNRKKEDLRNEILNIGMKEETDDTSILDQYSGAERRIDKYTNQEKQLDYEISQILEELKRINSEIDRLEGGAIDEKLINREKITKDVSAIAARTRKRIFDEIIQKLEYHANLFFKELTKENESKGGGIKIFRNADDTFSIEIRDDEGNKVWGLSEGFQRMKKLAVIMAIISNSDRGTMDYPLIADAPISTFGKGFIKGFFEKVPEAFNQSIVMVKDLYDNTSPSLINDVGESLLQKIKNTSGSFHVNQILYENSQMQLETKILRY